MNLFYKSKILAKKTVEKKRSYSENLKSKNKKYSMSNLNLFIDNANTMYDLQGWRNKLIDILPKFKNHINFADLGCGLGDKTYRLINNSNYKYKKIFLVDFSRESTKVFKNFYKNSRLSIFNSDIMLALDKFKNNSLDIVIAFGFVHELGNRKSFFLKLKKKMKKKSLLYISDNNFHFSADELNAELKECGIDSQVYKKLFNFFNLHIFYCPYSRNILSRFFYVNHKGRTDTIISISAKYTNIFKEI